jgi:hypothetical protein
MVVAAEPPEEAPHRLLVARVQYVALGALRELLQGRVHALLPA